MNNFFFRYLPLLMQITRFGLVGSLAALVHFSGVVMLVESDLLTPLYANAVIFPIAFQVSYWGHRSWTFSGTVSSHRTAFPKLLIVAGAGFAVNQSLFYVLLTFFQLPYTLALFMILAIVPVVTFVISKMWVFK